MDNINRIVVPVDNSDLSKKVVNKAVQLAKLLNLDIKLITINDTQQFMSSVILEDKLKKEAEAFLDEFVRIGSDKGINISFELISGKASEEIVRFVNNDDLIVMAHMERKTGLDQFFSEDISRDVVKNAPCSVFVIKN